MSDIIKVVAGLLALLLVAIGMLAWVLSSSSDAPSGGLPEGCIIGSPTGVFRDASTGNDVVLYEVICDENLK